MSWARAPKVRKYREGARIADILQMISALHNDRYVFVRGKPYHPAVLRNWSLASLEAACRYGARIAELTPEWIENEAAKIEAAIATEVTHMGEAA